MVAWPHVFGQIIPVRRGASSPHIHSGQKAESEEETVDQI